MELAYVANNWGNILSVIFFMISNVVFIDVIFYNVKTIAGYERDEILLFNLASQFWFFIIYSIFWKNFEILSTSVNSGEFDLVLTRPIPSMFYASFKTFNILRVVRDAIPSLLILVLAINWANLNIIYENLLFGLITIFSGIAISALLNLIVTLPVFWLGNNQGIIDLAVTIEDSAGHSNFVYEAWNDFWKIVFTIFFPSAISSALSTSIILGKSPALEMTIISISVLIIFFLIAKLLWSLALKNYTSASS